jgi:stage II sporulation protein M
MKKKSKNRFSIVEEYRKCWKYLKESRKFILVIIGFFCLAIFLGFTITLPQEFYDKIMAYIKDLLQQTEGLSHYDLIQFIFFNNIKSTFFGILFGVILGIFPLISAIANGYILGFVSFLSVNKAGISSLWRIFPHGIFELPAIFISLGLGLKLGTFIFQKKKVETFRNYFINSLRVFLLIIVPLLLVAAIIEGTLIILTK